jgi:cytochrome b
VRARTAILTYPRPPTSDEAIPVWDGFVRLFHWGTVSLVAAAFVIDNRAIHEAAGFAVAGLVLLRGIWGFAGGRHARFADFVVRPAGILGYLRELRAGRARRYLGHNPAGGAMVLLLLATLLLTTASGWMSETDRWFGVAWVADLHSAASSALLVLIGLHVAGVIVASRLHHENLVRAMITGRKPAEQPEAGR